MHKNSVISTFTILDLLFAYLFVPYSESLIRLKRVNFIIDIDASIKPDKLASQQDYQPDMTLNQKVAVWFGDITRLEIDAVVNSTNSTLLLEKVGGTFLR